MMICTNCSASSVVTMPKNDILFSVTVYRVDYQMPLLNVAMQQGRSFLPPYVPYAGLVHPSLERADRQHLVCGEW